ncbi:MAG: hypothetical protein A2431_03505 [Candidatus Zambryskibacteria bacterium RIFOXYC1_FULL_39_10]|uniref:Tellurite resistance methyltransferase TehB-like domain-containing protein n=1 Tax=Candidatus Zambryskibacteria bacterium RIFOXYC1_FULL_39_10 TaxID=1802779 RepID=A0A1G2UYE8_9BACT|nr:MAG: hypothetical protein A2431_03505 [Candidatus Zambryskibacteria bacterium RIFOXYC1_FULL_39_10]OHB16814.1 MAG: hypothetical protein A2605_01345 [Candidatus Zambryskibacteria bacterium RIFOXYD1_FULL_39_35]
MEIKLGLASAVSVESTIIGKRWDTELSKDESNPYPLAPKDLVRLGLVDEEVYKSENEKSGSIRNIVMEKELIRISSTPEFASIKNPEIKIFGVGLGRDLGWITKAVALGFCVRAYDASPVACNNFNSLTKDLPAGKAEVIMEDIESQWESIELDDANTLAYFASQFIQVQRRVKMRRIMCRLATLLIEGPLVPSLYLVHPFNQDNCSPREWMGTLLPRVEWGQTIAYSEDELFCPTGKLRKQLEVELLGVHTYFHHVYSFLKVHPIKG